MAKTEYYGACRYCGQQALIQLDDDQVKKMVAGGDEQVVEEYLKDRATFACSCEGARAYTNVERRIEKAKKRCDDIAPTESVGEIMKMTIKPLMMEELDKLTIKDGSVTYTVYMDVHERIHVKKEYKNVDDETN